MPLAHLVDPFKQVNLIVNDEETNGERNSTGEWDTQMDQTDENATEIEVGTITRPGCEKATTKEFELLRVLGQVNVLVSAECNIFDYLYFV